MVASNRLSDKFADTIARSVKRSSQVTELHYAVKDVSDEAFEYLLKVAKSLAVQDAGPVDPRGLIGQMRVLITGEHTADVAIVWRFRDEAFLSSEYRRMENGGWVSLDGTPVSPSWLTRLEDRYQEKRSQVELAARSEVAG
jgi:hypothetical protein